MSMEPQVFTFRANSLQEALQMVRRELGTDAAVVASRRVRKWGFLPFTAVEVQATRDVAVRRPEQLQAAAGEVAEPPPGREHVVRTFPEAVGGDAATAIPLTDVRTMPTAPSEPHSIDGRRPPVRARGERQAPGEVLPPRPSASSSPGVALLQTADGEQRLSPAALELLLDLTEYGLPADQARELLARALARCAPHQQSDPWMLRVAIHQTVAATLYTGGAIEKGTDDGSPQIAAVVGPTGVGKTTTLAKIAASARYDLGLRVAFLSLDTFRMGAVDQLRQYAELISAPLEVAIDPPQVREALQRLRSFDVVLIDTAGRAPRDQRQLTALRHMLEAAQPTMTHLVLSACTSVQHAEQSMERFATTGPTHLIVTKLDEAEAFGQWVPLLSQGRLPVSYLTTGQGVPDDIVVATPRRLSRELLGLERGQLSSGGVEHA
ncbi:MAG: flagellar biosynthesis protein FlhF [Pirellulaceae bacterium]|nr:MAG: flagellar biosynthesis protein FlhF [Pirellulaceae bacterium]